MSNTLINMTLPITGQCLCGAIQYKASAKPSENFKLECNIWVQEAPPWAAINTNLQTFNKNP